MITSKTLKQGDIVYVELDPAMGYEIKKERPCIIVSNNFFNHHYNTVWAMPISTSKKYLTQARYIHSPMFIKINKRTTNQNDPNHQHVYGTVMVQHLRSIDPRQRCNHGSIVNAKEVIPSIRLCVQMSI